MRAARLLATVLCLFATVAVAITPKQTATLFVKAASAPTWFPSGASEGCNLALSQCYIAGTSIQPLTSQFTVSRASPQYCQYTSGLWVSVANNVPCITDKGKLNENGVTNLALYSRDMTQAAWTASNITATKNAAGADGTANAASTLVATGANGTILQSLTSASNTYTYSFLIKCVTCTGNISIGNYASASYTVLSSSNCVSSFATGQAPTVGIFVRCYLTVASLTNPTFGIQIANAGDTIVVDFNQLEVGAHPSSPVVTSGTTAARAAETDTMIGAAAATLKRSTASLVAMTYPFGFSPSAGARIVGASTTVPLNTASNTQAQDYNGTTFLSATIGASGTFTANVVLSGTSWDSGNTNVAANDGIAATTASGQSANTTFYLGSSNGGNSLGGYITQFVLWNKTLTQTQLQTATNPNQAIVPGTIAAWGDSLTAGNQDGSGVTYPNILAAGMGVPVFNFGVGGYTSTQIASLFDSYPQYWGLTTIIWSGRNDYSTPSTVETNIAGMVADLTTTHYLVMSILNSELPNEQSGGANYTEIINLNNALSSTYAPTNYIDIRATLVAAYNPANGADVIDHTNDVPPFSLRAVDVSGTLAGSLNTSSCSFSLSVGGLSPNYIVTIGSEYIYISTTSNGAVTGCTRGYGGTTAASYSPGQALVATDPVHLNAAGYTVVANAVKAKLQANGWN
jgi:hypothetical protein